MCNGGCMDKKKCVFKQNLFWGPRRIFKFQPLDFDFPQFFFDIPLIKIRNKKSKWRKCFNDVMTELFCDVMTGGNIKKKIQAKRARGFRNMQQNIQPRARWAPPSLGRVNAIQARLFGAVQNRVEVHSITFTKQVKYNENMAQRNFVRKYNFWFKFIS